MDPDDEINYVWDILEKIKHSKKYSYLITQHFKQRLDQRFEGNIEFIFDLLLNKIPVKLTLQEDGILILRYLYNDKHLINIVVDIKTETPLKISLITCFICDRGRIE